MIARKVYTSLASSDLGMAEIENLLKVSRANNRRSELTGLLMFHDGKFFQVLEGDKAELDICYERILKDTRHERIRLLAETTSDTRAFPEWKMGFATPDDLTPEARQAVTELTSLLEKSNETRGDDERVKTLIGLFLISSGFSASVRNAAA